MKMNEEEAKDNGKIQMAEKMETNEEIKQITMKKNQKNE